MLPSYCVLMCRNGDLCDREMYVKSNRDDIWTTGVATDFILDVSEHGEPISNLARIESRARAEQRLDRG